MSRGRRAHPKDPSGGLPAAEDIEAALRYLETLPFVQPGRTVIVGQSAGGWAEGKPHANCAPDRLVAAAGKYGGTARLPTLWIYTENDSFFAPEISRAMHARYTAARAAHSSGARWWSGFWPGWRSTEADRRVVGGTRIELVTPTMSR